MTIGDLLDRLAVDLNDAAPGFENTVWSREQLRGYISEALQIISDERPELFVHTVTFKVANCQTVQEPCDCTSIRRVVGQTTASGRLLHQLRKRKNVDKFFWTGRSCAVSPKNFQLREYNIDADTDRLSLYPEVPAGFDVYVTVECSITPSDFADDVTVDGVLVPAIMQWVLYRAKAVDSENNSTIANVALAHKTAFWELVREQKNNEIFIAEQNDGRTN